VRLRSGWAGLTGHAIQPDELRCGPLFPGQLARAASYPPQGEATRNEPTGQITQAPWINFLAPDQINIPEPSLSRMRDRTNRRIQCVALS
jgi:hypothetical protein